MSRSKMLPTMADVARAAQVSTATVSRCINFPEQVVETTRLRVMDSANQLGYMPNFGARALAARRTNIIGAVIPTMENAIFARGLQAFQEELGRNDMTLLVASSSYRSDLEQQQIRSLISRGADGLLLIGYDRDPQLLKFLAVRKIPLVVAWVFSDNEQLPAVGFDNYQAMRELVQQVVRSGHRQIAVITAPRQHNDRVRERVAAINDYLHQHHCTLVTIIECLYSIANGGEALASIMQQHPEVTAIMCANDVLAVGAIRMARQLGFQVPQDISVTGFDDIELAQVIDPALTTVHVPHREMGRQAAQLLVRKITDNQEVNPIKLGTRVVIRASLAAPKQ